MKFRCRLNDDDIACFVRHYVQHSPAARRQVRNAWLYPSVAALAFFAFIGMTRPDETQQPRSPDAEPCN